MKSILLLVASMVLSITLWAQLELNYEIEFTHFQQDYIPLEEYTNLTEGVDAWDYSDFWDFTIPIYNPVVFPGFEDRPFDTLYTNAFAGMEFGYNQLPDDPYTVGIIGAALEGYLISPLADDNNADQGHILYLESEEGLFFEFQNVGFEEEMYLGSGLQSRLNFQVAYYFDDNCIEFHYGHSEIGSELEQYLDDVGVEINAILGWFYEEEIDGEWDRNHLLLGGWLNGDPAEPEFNSDFFDYNSHTEDLGFVTGVPEEGTVYRFCFDQTTSTEEVVELSADLTLYPNPATNRVYFSLPEEDASQLGDLNLQVVDLSGNVVIESEFGPDLHGGLNVEMLPAGMYFVRLTGEHLSQTVKVVIK
ncbi:MAG: T9SS C-terminal target domain-containing protein [Saprospirales bacterium]|nr:MAG: T9SS C-terminal target domain-containing protein [Saprospirales bacterium]